MLTQKKGEELEMQNKFLGLTIDGLFSKKLIPHFNGKKTGQNVFFPHAGDYWPITFENPGHPLKPTAYDQ